VDTTCCADSQNVAFSKFTSGFPTCISLRGTIPKAIGMSQNTFVFNLAGCAVVWQYPQKLDGAVLLGKSSFGKNICQK